MFSIPFCRFPINGIARLPHVSANGGDAGNGNICEVTPTIATTRHGRRRNGGSVIRTTGVSTDRRIRRIENAIAQCNEIGTLNEVPAQLQTLMPARRDRGWLHLQRIAMP
jgi:hypothetical protein